MASSRYMDPFDFAKPNSWPDWIQRFSRYRVANKLHKEDGDIQVSTLIYTMGHQGEKILSSFGLTDEELKDFNVVVGRFNSHFIPRINIIHERSLFHSRSQKVGENVEGYVRSLFELSENAGFHDREEAIRDRIVLGVGDRELSEILQLTADLTLDKAIEIARQREQVKSQLEAQRVNEARASIDRIDIKHSHKGQTLGRSYRGQKGNPKKKPICGKCGRLHYSTDTCSAKGKTCNKCGKLNHFANMCKTKQVSNVSQSHADRHSEASTSQSHADRRSEQTTSQPYVGGRKETNVSHDASYTQSVDLDSGMCTGSHRTAHRQNCEDGEPSEPAHSRREQVLFLGSIDQEEKEPQWRTTFTILNKTVSFKVDTGADVSVISESVYRSLRPRPSLKKSNAILQSPGGKINSLGQFVVHTRHRGQGISFRAFVIKGKTDNLLSRDAAVRLHLVQRIDATEVKGKVFGDIGTPVDTEPIRIEIDPHAEPYSIKVPRRIPIPLMSKVEAELKRMESCGVIEEITEPTSWCAPMVPVLKKNGEVRICVDLKQLNRAVKRERYTLPTLDDVTHKLANSKVYSKLDATSGFWQVPLDPETAKYTTFMTPFGRYYFKRLPFGINLAPEVFQRIMENVLDGCQGVVCFMDDVLVYGDSDQEHDHNLNAVLDRMNIKGLVLNKRKCEFKKKKVDFLGHTFSEKGIEPDRTKVQAIVDMPEPTNVAELRRFLGMVNYLGRFTENLSEKLHPLNELLRKDSIWVWGEPQKESFRHIKEILTSAPTLAFYQTDKPTVVCSDASSYGIGGVLYQEHEGVLRPVAFCSRTLTDAEQRYAQIEKECLAIVYACERFERYLIGLPNFRVWTDHRPLIPIVNKKPLTDTPLRCQRMLMRLMRYNLTAEYIPGKNLVVADALSRSPLQSADRCPVNLETDVSVFVDSIRVSWSVSDRKLENLKKATRADIQLSAVLRYIQEGWPEYKADCTLAAREYYSVKDELSEYDGLVTRGDRIVIPFSEREYVLGRIHDGHQGIQKCRERANQAVWWPGMGQRIKDVVGRCRHCEEKRPSQVKEPMIPSQLPQYPFQKVGLDLCELEGKHYLVFVDYYSRYIDVAGLERITSEVVIGQLKSMFARYGIPEVVVSDNGRQFSSSDFQSFASQWGFTHVTSSPHYAQSNGEAERAVQTVKHMLRQKDFSLAILTYRSTPIPSLGYSPAELAFGRKIRTTLPILPQALMLHDRGDFATREEREKKRQKQCYDRHYGVEPLPALQNGQQVLIKCDGQKLWNREAVVMDNVAPRSYTVLTKDGTSYRRNRRHLKTTLPQEVAVSAPAEAGSSPQSKPITPPVQQSQQPTQSSQNRGPAHHQSSQQAKPPDQPPAVVTTRSGRTVKKPDRFVD